MLEATKNRTAAPLRYRLERSATMAKATIIKVETPAELYCHIQGHQPQPCYIEVDLEEGTISATHDPEIGGGVPKSVWTGHVRRFRIPPLTADAANAIMEKIKIGRASCRERVQIW